MVLPPPPVTSSRAGWTPPPAPIAKSCPSIAKPTADLRQITFLTRRLEAHGRYACDTHAGKPSCKPDPDLSRYSRPWAGGQHATNRGWLPTKGSVVWDGTPSGPNQPSADCRRMQSTAENAGLRRQGRRTSLTTKCDSAVGGSTGDPQIPSWAKKDVSWASISSIPQAWPCHTATCAPAAQPLKLAYFQGSCLRNHPLGKPSPTILALTAAHNGVAEREEGAIRSRRIKGCTVSWR